MSATSTEEIIKSESSDVALSLLIKNPLSPSGRQSHLSLLRLIRPRWHEFSGKQSFIGSFKVSSKILLSYVSKISVQVCDK
jgi:hypothetical protein